MYLHKEKDFEECKKKKSIKILEKFIHVWKLIFKNTFAFLINLKK